MEKHKNLSVFLSLVLRHKPEVIGLALDGEGYLNVDELIKGINDSGRKIDMKKLSELVDTDNKKRYSFNDDRTKLRASQGHSIPVNLSLTKGKPTGKLFHGTAEKFRESIDKLGLLAGGREYVHLSDNLLTALKVGSRRGKPIVYLVDYEKMLEDDLDLWVSENGVWLSNDIPAKYLSIFNMSDIGK